MANYAHTAIEKADALAARRGEAHPKHWAPIIARVGGALAHAVCDLADAIRAKDGTE